MAAKPKITFSTNPNPRNRALIDGLIPIDGYDLEYIPPGRSITVSCRVSSMSLRCRRRR